MALFQIKSDTLSPALELLRGKLSDYSPLTKLIAGDLLDAVTQNFQDEGVPKWKPLAAATIRQRKRKGYWPGKILSQTGQLQSSISSHSDATSAIIGTNKKYAAIHQFGGTINMGARTRTLFHRTDAKGNLLKRSLTGDPDDNYMLIFAKKSHKRKAAYTFGQKAYSVIIPPRPFITLPDKYQDQIATRIILYVANVDRVAYKSNYYI